MPEIELTERALRTIRAAMQIAASSGKAHVDSADVFAAVLASDNPLVLKPLIDSGYLLADAQPKPISEGRDKSDDVDLSHDGAAVLRRAATVATEQSRRFVGDEHLLLAFVRDKKSPEAQALERAGVFLDLLIVALTPPPAQRSAKVDRYTESGKQTLDTAREMARKIGLHELTSVHILAALLHGDDGPAIHILKAAGADIDAIRAACLEHVPVMTNWLPPSADPLKKPTVPSKPALSSDAFGVVRRAEREATVAEADGIGAQHLLIGVRMTESGPGAGILADAGLSADWLRLLAAELPGEVWPPPPSSATAIQSTLPSAVPLADPVKPRLGNVRFCLTLGFLIVVIHLWTNFWTIGFPAANFWPISLKLAMRSLVPADAILPAAALILSVLLRITDEQRRGTTDIVLAAVLLGFVAIGLIW